LKDPSELEDGSTISKIKGSVLNFSGIEKFVMVVGAFRTVKEASIDPCK
jgi:hypothetical protein